MKGPPPPQQPPTELPQAAFDLLIAMLCDIVCTESHRLGVAMPLTLLIWQRIRRLAARFTWLAAHGPASLRARPRTPRPAKPAPEPDAASPQQPAPPKPPSLRGAGWLHRRLPSEQVAAAGYQLQYLLAQPYMVDLIEANPSLGRVLRPLCQMLGVPPPTILRIAPPAALFPPPARESSHPPSPRAPHTEPAGTPTRPSLTFGHLEIFAA